MYCPKCGTQNIDDASFCRACGANLSLVPQALAGRLPETRDESLPTGRKRRRDKEPRIDKAVTNVFMGVAFLLVAFMVKNYAPAGFMWWFWMLIPAFSLMGGGVAEFMRLRQANAARRSRFTTKNRLPIGRMKRVLFKTKKLACLTDKFRRGCLTKLIWW